MAEKRLFKEFNQLSKNPITNTNPQVLELQPKDPDNIFEWKATIAKPTKSDSPYYYQGQWDLDISVSSQYPIVAPNIRFSRFTPISHPNINIDTGEICLDILKSDNWSPAWNLQHLVGAILMLIDDPEPDSPLNVDSANLYRSDKVGFESFVQFIIWKYGTFYNSIKEEHGLKEQIDESEVIINEADVKESDENDSDVDAVDSDVDEEESDIEAEIKPEIKPDVSENESETEAQAEAHTNIIKGVGNQVTKEFIDKVDEINQSKVNSHDSTHDYNNAKRQIVENVNKQVNELVRKSVSPVAEEQKPVEPIDKDIEDEKKKFIQEIDKKVNAFNDLSTISTSSSKASKASGSTSKTSSTNKSKKSKRERLKKLIKEIT